MDESESKNEKPKEKRRIDPEQYKFLKECSEKGEEGIKEWNEWREEIEAEEILLEGANLNKRYLKGINLKFAHMKGAHLNFAHLEEANLWSAHLEGAVLLGAHLQGAKIKRAYLQGADFMEAEVDVHTVIRLCKVDRETDFRMVALDSVRIDSATKGLLECNIRRMNWEAWYKYKNWQDNKDERHIVIQKLMWFIRRFWEISDYGISTKQIIKTFFKLAFVFAIIYYIWGFIDYYLVGIKDYPGIVSDLFVLEDNKEEVSCWLVPFRAVYFSIVTMTTLGFGDMYANAHSFLRGLLGHTLLALQVILGYVLLGALVTRFAVLFTAGGPAGRFANEQKKKDEKKSG